MKKNLTKKLMLSVLTLAFAVVSLGASTFAWFTLSEKAEIQNFEATVQGGAGLELQVLASGADIDDTKWRTTTIDSNMIQTLIGNITLNAATPSLDDGKFTFTGTDKKAAFEKQDGAPLTGGWVQFDVAFRLSDQTSSETMPLYLNSYQLSTKNGSTVKEFRVNKEYVGQLSTDAAHPFNVNDSVKYYVSDAARLAIQKVVADGETAPAPQIYQAPKDDTHLTYTEGTPATNNAAVNYYNAVNENEIKADPSKKLSVPADMYTAKTSLTAETPDVLLGNLTGGSQIRITVLVWVEGWDAECINGIFAQTLQANLSFYLKLPTA